MRIIFLDIDGVLNSRVSIDRFNSAHRLCPDACCNLRTLVEQADAKIVITSAWRIRSSLDQIAQAINEGHNWPQWNEVIIGKTPRSRRGFRQDEIDAFIDNFDKEIIKFVVVDDDSADITTPWFVHVDRRVGLTINNVNQALEIINDK